MTTDDTWYFGWEDYEREIRDRAEVGIADDDAADDAAELAWQTAQSTAAAMAGIICWLHGGHLGRTVEGRQYLASLTQEPDGVPS